MNKLFFSTLVVVCASNYAYTQNQAMNRDKNTATELKAADLLKADTLPSVSGTCVLNLKKNATITGDTTGSAQALKNSGSAPKELYLNNAKANAIPTAPLKEEK